MSARGKRVAALVLAAVFLVGVLAGVALEDVLDDVELPELIDDEDDEEFDDEDAEEILEDIDLSREQRLEVEAILDRREDRLESYWSDRMPELRTIVDSSYAEIRAVLTPEQRVVFDRRLEEVRAHVEIDVRD